MKVLHITPNTDGFEEAKLLANRYSRKNGLAVIEIDGQEYLTGGLIFEDIPEIRQVMSLFNNSELYDNMVKLRITPHVKSYFNDHES